MPQKKSSTNKKNISFRDERFQKGVGTFLKNSRISAGYRTIKAFTDTIEMSYSQYQGYESGRINISISQLKWILLQMNIKPDQWLNIDLKKGKLMVDTKVDSEPELRVAQVMRQALEIDNFSTVSYKEVERFVKILIFCHSPKKRADIVSFLNLSDSSNTFQRVAGKLLDFKWLERTDNERKNSPLQRYQTTEEGKKVLKIDSE